jgi:hypothetical protein
LPATGTSGTVEIDTVATVETDHGRRAVAAALRDIHNQLNQGVGWENNTPDRYLEALAAWLDDCPGYYANQRMPVPSDSWSVLLDALEAAKSYE